MTVVYKDDLCRETSVFGCNLDWSELLIDHSTMEFAAYFLQEPGHRTV
jgi:hypothetical protein